jgi:hypothetical protein
MPAAATAAAGIDVDHARRPALVVPSPARRWRMRAEASAASRWRGDLAHRSAGRGAARQARVAPRFVLSPTRRRRYAEDVSVLAFRRAVLRSRRHSAALLVVLVVCGAVALHHSAIVMSDVNDGHGLSTAVELCVGVFAAVGAATALLAIGMLSRGRLRPSPDLGGIGLDRATGAAEPRSRAGPASLALLCVSRR